MTAARIAFSSALIACLCALPTSLRANDKDQDRLARRAAKIATTLETLQMEDSSAIPADIMQQAKGVIVLRQYEAGFVFGAKGGFGMAMKKTEDGNWGPPAWIKTGELSGGLQIGVQTLNVVFLIMKEDGLEMLKKPRFRIGVDATMTLGPTGTTRGARIGAASLLAYTDTEGLYAGATFDGGFLLPDRKANDIAYGNAPSVTEIISSETLPIPDYANRIAELLQRVAEGDL